MMLQTPAIYRIHEEPDARRLQEYRQEVLAYHVPCGNLNQPAEVQKLLSKLGTLPIGAALKIGFLKSLMRARYAVEPLGHYGLAKKNTRTSPRPSAVMPTSSCIARCLTKMRRRQARSSRLPNTFPLRKEIPPTPSATART